MSRPPDLGRDVDTLVREEILRTLHVRHGTVVAISSTDDFGIVLGLSSSDVAEIVGRLGAQLRVGPTAIPITDLRTVGDLCRAARKALAGQDQPAAEMDELAAARRRAQARRARE